MATLIDNDTNFVIEHEEAAFGHIVTSIATLEQQANRKIVFDKLAQRVMLPGVISMGYIRK